MLLRKMTDGDVFAPLNEIQHLQRQLNRLLLPGTTSGASPEFPSINVWTSEEGAVVRTEIPGVNADEVDISLVNDTLTIKGERRSESTQEDETCHRQERGFGQFARSVKLPFTIEPDAVKAEFGNGVLQIELPRAAAEKPRRISVQCE